MANRARDKWGYKKRRVLIERGRVVLFTGLFFLSPHIERIRIPIKALVYKGLSTYPEYPQT